MNSSNSITSPNRRFIKRQDVESITGLSCNDIYRRIAAGTFPKQVELGPKCVVWVESEIHNWCDEQIAVRDLRFTAFRSGKKFGKYKPDLGRAREFWIVPVIYGSKHAGFLQAAIGTALIVATSFATGGLAAGLIGAGISNVAGGVLQLLSSQISRLRCSDSPENLAAYVFENPKKCSARPAGTELN